MGVLLGHVINMDYKCLIGKIVLNLQPTTLLLLEVALWKAFFSALCGRFGGCNKHCACLGQGWTNGGSWTSRTFSTQQGSWEVMGFGGLRKQGLCPVLQHLLQEEWATVAVAVKTHLQAHRVGAGLPRSAVPQLQEWERARLVLRAFLASPKSWSAKQTALVIASLVLSLVWSSLLLCKTHWALTKLGVLLPFPQADFFFFTFFNRFSTTLAAIA